LNQDLSFYRGLVQPETLIHVKVQQMQIIPDGPPGLYHLKFVLMQTGKSDKEVVGSAAVTLDGLLGGKPLSMNYAQVSPGHRVSLAYSLKYFQEYNEPIECRQALSRRAWVSRFIAAETPVIVSGKPSYGRHRACRWKPRPTAIFPAKVKQMFKPKPNKKAEIDTLTLIGAKTRINGDVEFVGGLHLDGHINGNVKSESGSGSSLSVSEQGCIEGSVVVTNISLNGLVKGDIEASDRVELGPKARVLGSVHYTTIETAVGAQNKWEIDSSAESGARVGQIGSRRGERKSQRRFITLIWPCCAE